MTKLNAVTLKPSARTCEWWYFVVVLHRGCTGPACFLVRCFCRYRISGDLALLRDVPLLLSVCEGKRYALRLASVSALLAYYYADYRALCMRVHELGVRARWTHGWSGLVSCYSMW